MPSFNANDHIVIATESDQPIYGRVVADVADGESVFYWQTYADGERPSSFGNAVQAVENADCALVPNSTGEEV